MVFKGFHGDVQLSLGYLLGVRGFRIDTMGRFTGWSYESVWTPGENTAVCNAQTVVCPELEYSIYTTFHIHTKPCYKHTPCNNDIENCDHGFWAYFEDFDGQGGDSLSMTYPAIIKGYGRTVVGDKGFRSEKAEILAAVVPWSYDTPALPRALVERNYPDVRIFETKEEMFSAYPAQDETPKQPIDPKDPEFWAFDPTSEIRIIRRTDQKAKVSS